MEHENLLQIAKAEGFESIEDYIKGNLQYLSPDLQRIISFMLKK